MYRAVSFTLAAMAMIAVVAAISPPVDTTQIISAVGSAFNSTAHLSRDYFRRSLTVTSISFDSSLIGRARFLAVGLLHTIRHAVKGAIVPYIYVARRFVPQAMEQRQLSLSAGVPHLPRPSTESITYRPQPRPSVESITYHYPEPDPYPQYGSYPQFDSYPWDAPYYVPQQDPFENPSTIFLMLASSFITATFCIAVGSAISIGSAALALLRFAWRVAKAVVARFTPKRKGEPLARPAANSDKPWNTGPAPPPGFFGRSTRKLSETIATLLEKSSGEIIEGLIFSIFMFVAVVLTLVFLASTFGLTLFVNIGVLFVNSPVGLKLRAPPPPPPLEIPYSVPDPRVPQLLEDKQKLQKAAKETEKIHQKTCEQKDAKLKKEKDEKFEILKENNSQSWVIEHQASIMQNQQRKLDSVDTAQVEEREKRVEYLQKENGRLVEEKNKSDAQSARDIAELQTIQQQERDSFEKERKEYRDRSQTQEQTIQDLEKEREEHIGHIKTQDRTIQTLEGQRNERDESLKAWERTIQDLNARTQQQERQLTSAEERFDRDMEKIMAVRRRLAADLKTAQAARKAETRARKAETRARKSAEKELEATREALRPAEKELEDEPATDEESDDSSATNTTPPPDRRRVCPPKSAPRDGTTNPSGANNGAESHGMNSSNLSPHFDFSSSTTLDIFGGGPSPKPGTSADPSLPEPTSPTSGQPEPSDGQPEPSSGPDSTTQQLKDEIALLKFQLAKGRPTYDDKNTQTSPPSTVPPPHQRDVLPAVSVLRQKPKRAPNSATVNTRPPFNDNPEYDFSSLSTSGIFGGDPSPQSGTPTNSFNLNPNPNFDFGFSNTSGIFGGDPSPEPETSPDDPSPPEPASPSGQQPEPSGPTSA